MRLRDFLDFGILQKDSTQRFSFLDSRILIFLFVLIFLYLFFLNIFMPPQADDIHASIRAKRGFDSAITSYLTWNARIGELLFVGFVGGWSDIVFDFINALFGSIFIWIFFVFIFLRFPKNDDIFCILLICFCLLYFAPFGADFLWVAGSLNYMWGILILMLALLPYRIFWNDVFTNKNQHIIKNPLIVFISFFAGMASEQLGIITILCHICLIIYARFRRIKLGAWYFGGVVFFVFGYLCLYLSPGHASRSSLAVLNGQFLTISEILDLSFGQKINRILSLLNYSMTDIFRIFFLIVFFLGAKENMPNKSRILYFVFAFFLASLVFLNNNSLVFHIATMIALISIFKKHRIYKIIFILYILYLLLCLSAIQILGLPPRARLGDILVLVATFCVFYQCIKDLRFINLAICGICVVYSGFVASEYYNFYDKWNHMLIYIEKEKQRGNYDVIYENIFISKYPNFIDSPLPTDIIHEQPNPLYAYKFGLKSLRIDEVYKDLK